MAGRRLHKQIRNRDSWQKGDSWGSRFCLILHEVRRLTICHDTQGSKTYASQQMLPFPSLPIPSHAWTEHHCKTKLNNICFSYVSEPSVAENICIYSLWSSFSFKITSQCSNVLPNHVTWDVGIYVSW